MRKRLAILTLLTICTLSAHPANAAGTASGTSIVNTATATYNDGGLPVTKTATATVVVDNKVNLTVTKNADITVTPGSTNQAILFVVKNDGNTPQGYALAATNSDGTVIENVRIYRDNGTTAGVWDATDTLYTGSATTFGDVLPDGILQILIVADAKATATNGQFAHCNLVPTTVDAGTNSVTIATVGAGTALGVDVVFADIAGTAAGDVIGDGKHSAYGTYTVSALTFNIVKSALIVSDPVTGIGDGTTIFPKAIPGAIIRYTITVTVTGSGTAGAVNITDPIPTNSTYIINTLKLNGTPLTDVTGDDIGSVAGVAPGIVTVTIGDLTGVSAVQNITFEVAIN